MAAPQALPPAIAQALREVIDPESGIDIVNMGLVQSCEETGGALTLGLILTSAACPMGEMIVEEAEAALQRVAGPARQVHVQVLDAPAWHPRRLSPEARDILGWEDDDGE
jgi:metal-sulfur cluster biosynthetic enzyme